MTCEIVRARRRVSSGPRQPDNTTTPPPADWAASSVETFSVERTFPSEDYPSIAGSIRDDVRLSRVDVDFPEAAYRLAAKPPQGTKLV
jgi:hypothetical protein